MCSSPMRMRRGTSWLREEDEGFTGFAAGGEKGLGLSNVLGGDERLVLAESLIDTLCVCGAVSG